MPVVDAQVIAAPDAMRAQAGALLRRSFVWDNHSCLPLRPGDDAFIRQLHRAQEAGCSAITVNIGFGDHTPEQHLRVLAWFRDWLSREPGYLLVRSPADLDRAVADNQLAVMFDAEGARAIGDQPSLVPLYRELGVVWMLIAYNRANLVGAGCYDDPDGGLTAFGRTVIAEMNRVGMMVCVSHTGGRTAREVMDASTRPVIVSHSNCRAVHDHPRNFDDDLIRRCAAQDGVVGINGIGTFLGPPGADLVAAAVAHIDHAVQLVGPRHVGVSLDYVWDQAELRELLAAMPDLFPDGLPDPLPLLAPEAWPAIVEGLLARGYRDADLALIVGGAWRRVAEANWAETAVAA